VNLSPKGRDSLRVTGPRTVLWRNLTGSGNETAGHLRLSNRITLMWCSFDRRPIILRAYGSARVTGPGDPGWAALDAGFPPDPGAGRTVEVTVVLVPSSCGYGLPFMDFVAERDTIAQWSAGHGPDGIRAYWAEKNTRTIDGYPTGIAAAAAAEPAPE